jgi:hypothetical protein
MSYEEEFGMNIQNLKEANYNEACEDILLKAYALELHLEVIGSAFKHKEQFPDAPLLECLQVGEDIWDI